MGRMSDATPTPGSPSGPHDPRMPQSYPGDGPATGVASQDAVPGLEPVVIGAGPLDVEDVVRVARHGAPVIVAPAALGMNTVYFDERSNDVSGFCSHLPARYGLSAAVAPTSESP